MSAYRPAGWISQHLRSRDWAAAEPRPALGIYWRGGVATARLVIQPGALVSTATVTSLGGAEQPMGDLVINRLKVYWPYWPDSDFQF